MLKKDMVLSKLVGDFTLSVRTAVDPLITIKEIGWNETISVPLSKFPEFVEGLMDFYNVVKVEDIYISEPKPFEKRKFLGKEKS